MILQRADFTYDLEGFRAFCLCLKLENGRPFRLEAHEIEIVEAYFVGAIELVVILSKKNGKTTLLAALALFHLLMIDDAECVIGASSEDQATILFGQAGGLVERSGLEGVFDVKRGYRVVFLRAHRRSRIRVLASDARTGDGVIPTLALVDELHRHKNADLYGVFRDGLEGDTAVQGQMITISTAGARTASPLGELRKAAYRLPSFRREEARRFNRATSADGSFVFLEWCLSDTDDPDDIDTVKLVNPASWQTKARLRRRHDSPSMLANPWRWLRFACGIWTEGDEPWLEPKTWDVLAEASLEIGPTEPCYVDVRTSFKRGAIVLGTMRPDGLAVEADIFEPPTTYGELEQALREIAEDYNVRQITHGGRGFTRSAELLEEEGLPMVEFPASPERMSEASGSLQRLVQAAELHHDGDPELRAQVLAGRAKTSERDWRLTEDPEAGAPIHALIALAVVAHVVGQSAGEPGMRIIGDDEEAEEA